MYIDKRIIYIIIGVMALSGIMNYLTDINALLVLLLTIPGVLIAITFHEFAHAFIADKLGDDTPRMGGRLTLNPLKHLDPIGSLMLLFAGFGWGKPVQVNPRNYRRTMSMDKADAIVAIAGPIMNFLLAILLTTIYCAIIKFASRFIITQAGMIIAGMVKYAILINIGLGLFNLIPLPPLDGSKVLKAFLPFNAKVWFENNERVFQILFAILWIVGILSIIISPVIQIVFSGFLQLGELIFRI